MRRITTIAIVTATLLTTSCGSDSASFSGNRSTNGPLTTTTPPDMDGTVAELSREFWHSGFHVTLDAAEVWTTQTVLTNRVSYWLTLRGDFANQGDEVAAFEPAMAIRSGGQRYNQMNGDPPRLRPNSTARGEITFLIPEDLDFDSAVLVVGDEAESQALAPLGTGGASVDLRPTEVVLDESATSDLADIHLSGVLLRHDIPERYQQLEMGKVAMTVHFDLTNRSRETASIAIDDVALMTSDGAAQAAELAELSRVAGSEEGETSGALSATFIVDDDVAGDWSLRLQLPSNLITDDSGAELLVGFSL